MQKIAVLIDLTEGSLIAFKQAQQLAKRTNAEITAVHVASSNDKAEQAGAELRGFIAANSDAPHTVKTDVVVGDLMQAVPSAMKKVQPDMVVVCSHGIRGIAQHLFGSKILHLAEVMRYPMIILHENNKVDLGNADTILFPLGPHPDFEIKIRQTAAVAKAMGASVVMYEIETPGSAPLDQLEKNKEASKKYFAEQNIAATYVLDEMRFMSVGFSRQTLAYAIENKSSMISLMATVSNNDIRFGAGDKENLVNNTDGIPVLVCMA